ncbi:MAG: tetratricopeptide repeat protein [Acidobacteriota bacterium]
MRPKRVLAPTAFLALIFLPTCASRINKEPIAREDATRALRVMMEGDRLLKAEKDHLALLRYVEASTLNPYSEIIFNKLAVAYARLLRFDQAKKAVDRAVRLNPDYASAQNTRGIIFLALQNRKKAIGSFKRAIHLNPAKPSFYVNLGTAYLHRGNYEEARQAFLKARELDPEVFGKEGKIRVSTGPATDSPEQYYQMAKLFAELGDKESSLNYLSKAFSCGFQDQSRLMSESAFEKFKQDTDFIRLIQSWGLQS